MYLLEKSSRYTGLQYWSNSAIAKQQPKQEASSCKVKAVEVLFVLWFFPFFLK